jgi:hypothetical protein
VAKLDSNTIIRFADDTTVDNNLSLYMRKTKNMIVDYRKRRAPIHIDGAVVEQVKSFTFLGVHITNKLSSSSKHTNNVVKSA